ncbi:MAG: class I SAM-dependent methyltransferase [Alphaproteobacteria bacterium]|nr:class I SAM-dependent methyltransferase [Alphaproteobacteria bacterium]
MEEQVYAYHNEEEGRHWWFVSRRRVLTPLIDFCMRQHRDDLIVDVGCGTGGTVSDLSPRFACIGIDHSQQAIAMARGKYPHCRFVCGPLESELPALAPNVALYTLMDVLEHIEDDRGFLNQIAIVMRPGSRLLITVPADMSLWSEHDVAARHLRRYDSETLAALWKNQPLKLVAATPFNARLYPLIRMARLIGKWFGVFNGRGGRDLATPPWPINRLLTAIFSSEQRRISSLVSPAGGRPFRRGTSLLALLERI